MTLPRIVATTMVLFALVLMAGLMAVQAIDRAQQAQQRRVLSQVAASNAQGLQSQLDRSLSATLAMASLIRQFKDIQDFEIVAADILESYGGLNYLALAPGGVITTVYPAQLSEREIGRNLLQDPILGDLAQAAVDSGQMAVSAPLLTARDTQSLVAQLPVFLPDDLGRERFWGFALAVVDVRGVIQASGLPRLGEQGYEYSLRYGGGQNSQLLSRSPVFDPRLSVSFEAELPNGVWTLYISDDIVATNPWYLGGAVALAAAFSALVSGLAFALMRQPLVLKREVNIRTEELSQANWQLEVEVDEHKRTEEKYRDLFRNASDGIYLLDRKGCFTSLNLQAERLMGFSEEELLGKPYDTVVAPQDRLRAKRTFFQNLRGKLQNFEIVLCTKHGKQLVGEMRTRPIYRGNQIVGVQGIGRDITERKALEQMKDEFVSTVSHELRTPLTSIKGYAELLEFQQDGALNEQQRGFVDIIIKNSKRLTGLIDDLLDMAKLDAGQLQFEMRRQNVGAILKEVQEAFGPRAKEKSIALNFVDHEPLYVRGDYERLVQVFSNLVSNAVKYTEQGTVGVRAYSQNGSVCIEVSDSGVGISPEDIEQLFEKFFRSANAYTQAKAGTGLGLAITKTIVDHHHGNIKVDSQLGEGSVFSVLLPRVD